MLVLGDTKIESVLRKAGAWLHRRAENVAAALLAVMFVAFIVQIVFRYLFNFPIGWTSELTVITWLWLVLWGAAFVVKESEEIRFDLIYSARGPPHAHRVIGIITGDLDRGPVCRFASGNDLLRHFHEG